jgi:hypothetical protein
MTRPLFPQYKSVEDNQNYTQESECVGDAQYAKMVSVSDKANRNRSGHATKVLDTCAALQRIGRVAQVSG